LSKTNTFAVFSPLAAVTPLRTVSPDASLASVRPSWLADVQCAGVDLLQRRGERGVSRLDRRQRRCGLGELGLFERDDAQLRGCQGQRGAAGEAPAIQVASV